MANNIDVITTAYRLAGIITETEAPSAEQARDGLRSMNRMLLRWNRDGIELGYYEQDDLTDETPVPDDLLDGVEYNLAKRLAGENGQTLDPAVAMEAQESYDALIRETIEDCVADMDHMPGSIRYVYDIGSGR